jgi:hypothetical protein
MKIAKLLKWAARLGFIPSGVLTVASGWLSLLVSLACIIGVESALITCPANPVAAFVSAATGLGLIGLGRRGNKKIE